MKYKKLCSFIVLCLLMSCTTSVPAAAIGIGLPASVSSFAADTKTPTPAAKSTSTPKPGAASTDDALSGTGGVQSYAAETALENGTIVMLKDSKTNTVAVSTKADLANMYGVTVDRSKLSLTVSNSGVKNEVYVATSGTYDVLVSTQNGPIAAGDYVTLSAINGVAMKANDDTTTVFGRAALKFDGKSDTMSKATLKAKDGKQTPVAIGLIPVSIDVKRNPNEKSTKANLPAMLQRIGEAIAEKPIGPLRLYLSVTITAVTVFTATVILYSGIRNSLIAIGRNPLTKKTIFRGLLEVIFTGILIMIIGLFAVYLLLKL